MIKKEMETLRAMLAGALQPRPSSRRTPFAFLVFYNGFATSAALAAFSAHSAFSFCAHAETNTPDYDPDPRGGAFLDNSASFRARFLNDVVVRKRGRNRQNCQSGTGQNCSHDKSPLMELDTRRRVRTYKCALEPGVPRERSALTMFSMPATSGGRPATSPRTPRPRARSAAQAGSPRRWQRWLVG